MTRRIKKREPLIGSVEERHGRHRAVWWLDGDRQRKLFDTHDEACDFLDDMFVTVNRGGKITDASRPRTPFRKIAEDWYSARPAGREYASSRGRERAALNRHLLPTFGDTAIGDISRKDIQRWINAATEDPSEDCAVCEDLQYRNQDDNARCEDHAKARPLSARSVGDYYGILGMILRDAYLDGYGEHGALCPIGKGLHQLPRATGRMVCLDDAEMDHLLEVAGEWLPDRISFELSAHAEQIPLCPGDVLLATQDEEAVKLDYVTPTYLLDLQLNREVDEQQIVDALRSWNREARVTRTTRTSARASGSDLDWLMEEVGKHPVVLSCDLIRSPGDTFDLDELIDNA